MDRDLWTVYSKRSTKDLRRMLGEKRLLMIRMQNVKSFFAEGERLALTRQMRAIEAVLAARAAQAELPL